jgi:hypothetical protein
MAKHVGVRQGAGAAVLLLAVAGCGVEQVDIGELEDTIADGVQEQSDLDVEVDCPGEVEWVTGESFTCELTDAEGTTRTATVTMVDDDGNVRWEVEE